MNTGQTSFSRGLLWAARRDAKAYGVRVPRNLVALRSGHGLWFVQGDNDKGDNVRASDAFEARANYILHLINQRYPQLTEA